MGGHYGSGCPASLPLSLEKLAEFFGLKKDMEGHRMMNEAGPTQE